MLIWPRRTFTLGDSGIVLGGDDDARQLLGVGPHRAELEHQEFLKTWTRSATRGTILEREKVPGPALPEEDLPGRLDVDRQRDEGPKREDQQQSQAGARHINQPLGNPY
jgi:hypothetical protein